ncbi:MAG: LexA family transcriptional regulator [Alphaproteobacteria bacterium]|nr:LexA family transcriptional regulator [Alphaproteobacteria bacterium]
MLTKRQSELLIYLDRHLQEHGVCPSYDEMREAIGLHSKSGIHRLITALEEREFIRRLPNRARAIEIIRMPHGHATNGQGNNGHGNNDQGSNRHNITSHAQKTSQANDKYGRNTDRNTEESPFGRRQVKNLSHSALSSSSLAKSAQANTASLLGRDGFSVPYFGKIAAGTPIEALRNEQDRVMLPPQFVGSGEFYALRVDGESMIEAGILDGDIVVIKAGTHAENGQIIVALVDESEVTLKRLRRRAGSIALEPANANYEVQIFPEDRVKIQGTLVGLMRQY